MKHTEIWTCAASIIAAALIAGMSLAVASGYQDETWQARAEAAVYKADCMGLTAQVQDLTDTVELLKHLDALPAGMTATYAGEFLCTSYDANCEYCGTTDICYSGEAFTAGVSCALNKSLLDKYPLGTWLYIEDIGIRRVTDIGGGVAVNQIDVAVPGTHEDALNWDGYGMHKVYVLKGE